MQERWQANNSKSRILQLGSEMDVRKVVNNITEYAENTSRSQLFPQKPSIPAWLFTAKEEDHP